MGWEARVALAGVMAETIKAAIAVLGSMGFYDIVLEPGLGGLYYTEGPGKKSTVHVMGALLRHASRLTIEYLGAIRHHVGWVWTSPAAAIRSRFVGSEPAELNQNYFIAS